MVDDLFDMGKKRKHNMMSDWEAPPDIDSSIQDRVDNLFQKHFMYQNPNENKWKLPEPSEMFKATPWMEDDLQKMKAELNAVKGLLSDQDISPWHKHTQNMNLAGTVISQLRRSVQPELCTQAWCKFHELLCQFPIVSPGEDGQFLSVHLCEAPGAFITSLNHFLVQKWPGVNWTWLGTTLNPYYEGNNLHNMISDDRFIFDTLDNWYFGKDNTGDLMCLDNLNGLMTSTTNKAYLVTADGSIDCQDNPAEQEAIVARLHLSEVIAAISILSPGGAFVLKMFTLFEDSSVCLMFFLNCLFQQVHITKPATSKPGNSEVYVVCLHFTKPDDSHMNLLFRIYGAATSAVMFSLSQIPQSFLAQHMRCAGTFKDYQEQTIRSNLQLFENMTHYDSLWLEQARQYCAKKYIEMCDVWPIRAADKIVNTQKAMNSKKSKQEGPHVLNERRQHGTYNNRCQVRELSWQQRVAMMELLSVSPPAQPHWLHLDSHLPDAEDVLSWQIISGLPVSVIHSTRFADMALLNQYNELAANCKVNNLELAQKECGIPHGLSTSNSSLPVCRTMNTKSLSVKDAESDTQVCAEKVAEVPGYDCHDNKQPDHASTLHKLSVVKQILQTLECMDTDGAVVTIDVPNLLTRFYVGIFYILAASFEQVYLHKSEESDWSSLSAHIVVMNSRKDNKPIIDHFRTLHNALDALIGQKSPQDILQIVPFSCLYGSDFYSYVHAFNDDVMKRVVNTLITRERAMMTSQSTSASSDSSEAASKAAASSAMAPSLTASATP